MPSTQALRIRRPGAWTSPWFARDTADKQIPHLACSLIRIELRRIGSGQKRRDIREEPRIVHFLRQVGLELRPRHAQVIVIEIATETLDLWIAVPPRNATFSRSTSSENIATIARDRMRSCSTWASDTQGAVDRHSVI